MKRWFFVFLLIVFVYLAYNHQRVYIRDPFANVTFNGVKDPGAQVFLNYSNDVLLENDNAPMYVTLVQHFRHVGLPTTLHCVHYLVCMTDADNATLTPNVDAAAIVESMSNKAVLFVDGDGRQVVVTLR
jgi:hypothetical protein